MKKELLTVEFRYNDTPDKNGFGASITKTITIGVFETLEEAIEVGNNTLKILSKSFEVRSDDKFSKNGGCFGTSKRLVTNCCYQTKGIQYFAKITPLNFDNIEDVINEAFKAQERYAEWKRNEDND